MRRGMATQGGCSDCQSTVRIRPATSGEMLERIRERGYDDGDMTGIDVLEGEVFRYTIEEHGAYGEPCPGSGTWPMALCHIIGPHDIPEATHGRASIKRKVLEQRTMVGRWSCPTYMEAGDIHVDLKVDDCMWMSNTPDEIRSMYFTVPDDMNEHPNILIGGLGLGVMLEWIQIRKLAPAKVVVVEIDPDVIALVAPTYSELPWLEVVEGDIKEYGRIGERDHFDVAWIDIWRNYNADLLPEMQAIRRGLRRVMRPGPGRVHCWREEDCKHLRDIGY